MHDTRKKKYSVWSDDFLYAHMLVHYAACRWKWSFGMTSVYGTIQIVAAALHVKNGIPENAFYLGQLCQPFIRRTQINCVLVTGSLRQMDIADKCLWSTIRSGWLPRGSKLHVVLLLCMCRNHTHLCICI
jgi:hypothetical protein